MKQEKEELITEEKLVESLAKDSGEEMTNVGIDNGALEKLADCARELGAEYIVVHGSEFEATVVPIKEGEGNGDEE